MKPVTYGFIGLGLIGGSIAKSLKRVYADNARILAFDTDLSTLLLAQSEGVIDVPCSQIDSAFRDCAYLFLCAPVSYNDKNLSTLKPFLPDTCILTDVGSVKTRIHEAIASLDMEASFIGGHPMTGSEKTGFSNASDRLLENAYYIITPTEKTTPSALQAYQELVSSLGALPLILDYAMHDYVTAAVSHLPHIIAASLVNLVRDSDTADGIMKLIAAGGFKDITRIASSSPAMWQQISLMNTDNIRTLLNRYIASLQAIENDLCAQKQESLYALFADAGNYRNSFADAASGPIKKIYLIYVDIPDEAGVIATIATILAAHQINLKNIGIVHNREFEEGALRIEFYEDNSMNRAVAVLQKHSYTLFERK